MKIVTHNKLVKKCRSIADRLKNAAYLTRARPSEIEHSIIKASRRLLKDNPAVGEYLKDKTCDDALYVQEMIRFHYDDIELNRTLQ